MKTKKQLNFRHLKLCKADDEFGMYKPISLALTRRVFPDLFAHKLVGVQPMSAPVGTSLAMRTIYKGNSK
jgi:hypothetical protein